MSSFKVRTRYPVLGFLAAVLTFIIGLVAWVIGFVSVIAVYTGNPEILETILLVDIHGSIPVLGIMFVAFATGLGLMVLGPRLAGFSNPDVRTVLKNDNRRPILYLRQFDEETFLNEFETDLTAYFNPAIGPVIAIGNPGDVIPKGGASRLYVDSGDWELRVKRLMRKSQLVIVQIGTTAGLLWELEIALKRMPSNKIILIIPCGIFGDPNIKKHWNEFRQCAEHLFAFKLPERIGKNVRAVYFDDCGGVHIRRYEISKRMYRRRILGTNP